MMNYKKTSIKVSAFSLVLMIGVVLAGFLTACTLNQDLSSDSTNEEGIVLEGINVPEQVLQETKIQVEQLYQINKNSYPDYNYSNWRIEALKHVYTYDDFEGMTLLVYQMNYEFLSESPENVMLVGGMYITDDGWVMPNYPNSMYLIFQQDKEELTFLHAMMENDCFPGDETFTNDLQQALDK